MKLIENVDIRLSVHNALIN